MYLGIYNTKSYRVITTKMHIRGGLKSLPVIYIQLKNASIILKLFVCFTGKNQYMYACIKNTKNIVAITKLHVQAHSKPSS